jgi:hypothetical protein
MEHNMSEWKSIEEEAPEGNRPFLAADKTGYIKIGYVNWLTGHDGEPGIYMPAKHGEGMRVCYWMPIPDLPNKRKVRSNK